MSETSSATGVTPAGTGPSLSRGPFTVRPYRPQDGAEASRLYRECFAGQRDPAEWPWKFDRRLSHGEPVFHVAETEGRLVGLYPTRAVRLQIGDDTRVAVHCQDVCVHPAHRGGAILRAMLRANESAWRAADVPLAFGFPTDTHMMFGSRFMGYVEMFRLHVCCRRLARGLRLQTRLRSRRAQVAAYAAGSFLQGLLDLRNVQRPDDALRVTELRQFDASTDTLWDRVRASWRFAVVRDAVYLTWRYLERPGRPFRVLGARRSGRLDGYCVFRDNFMGPDRLRAGALMDLVATDTATARLLVETALARMRTAHCAYALALTHPTFPTAPALTAAGFAPDRSHAPIVFCAKFCTPDLDVKALREPGDWLLAYGDTDHLG